MFNYKTIIIVCLTVVNCGCAKQVIDVNASQAFTLGNENVTVHREDVDNNSSGSG